MRQVLFLSETYFIVNKMEPILGKDQMKPFDTCCAATIRCSVTGPERSASTATVAWCGKANGRCDWRNMLVDPLRDVTAIQLLSNLSHQKSSR